MSTQRILILSDGRSGHTNLSEGIAAALARRQSVSIEHLEVDRGKWPGPVAALLTRSAFTPQHILKVVYGIDGQTLPPADMIISAGAETLAANISIARLHGAQNIFYGSLRQYRAADFTLVLTSFARQAARAPNIVQALKPSALDPDTLPKISNSAASGAQLGLLVGGPSGAIAYTGEDWAALTTLIEDAHKSYGIRWIVSNSRRTPPEASTALRQLAATENSPISDLIDVDGPAASALPDMFARVTGIVCTADSSSMISEAIWALKPVLAVEPRKFSLTQNEQDYRNWLIHNGWCSSIKIAALSAEKLPALIGELKPAAGNPLDNLADVLEANLPQRG